MSKLTIPFIFIISLLMTACSSDDNHEIYPVRFEQQDYTIRIGTTARINFVNGGGVYELTASNPDIFAKFVIDIEVNKLIVIPACIGESTLTVTDVITNTSVTLKFTVEDFYLSFNVSEINGDNSNSYLNINDEIRFIRDKDNTKQIKIMRQSDTTHAPEHIANGYFDINRNETNIFTLHMELHSRHGEELVGFNYNMGGDWEYLNLFERCFEYDWDKSIASKSQPPRQVIMILTDTFNGCRITCSLQPF